MQKSNKQAKTLCRPFFLALPRGEMLGFRHSSDPTRGHQIFMHLCSKQLCLPKYLYIQLLWATTSYAQQDRHFGAGWGEGAATRTQLFTQGDVSVHELLGHGHKEKQTEKRCLAFPKELPQTMPCLLECAAFSLILCAQKLFSLIRDHVRNPASVKAHQGEGCSQAFTMLMFQRVGNGFYGLNSKQNK